MSKFVDFYNEHKDKLLWYLLRISNDPQLAKDIMQESFTRYLASYGNTKKSPALLFTIARNLMFDARRRSRRVSESDEKLQDPNNPEELLIVKEQYLLVLSSMQKLKPSERDILALVVGGQLSYRDIAEITGLSEANVKVKVHRARVKLKQILELVSHEELFDKHVHR